MVVEISKGIAFHNFSTWNGLKRAVIWIKKCVAVRLEKKSGKDGQTRTNQLTSNELEEAERVILKMVHHPGLPREADPRRTRSSHKRTSTEILANSRKNKKKVCHRCPACRRATAKPVMPEMGALPFARVTRHTRPFIETGLEYFGPMYVTVGRSRVKRYGALFTCLTMRVELAEHLTIDSAIMAIRRFIAIRGTPETIHCDNETNFHSADTELKKSLAELNQDKIQKDLADQGIKWKYIPPSALHMGGSWERMVKSVKVALNAVLKDHAPKEEVLRTLIAEAVHSVNSRPLTYVSLDPADREALTPNHFLIGASSNAHPPDYSAKQI